ncbi:unnamed protein product [Cuscuta epithymum]|uniref:WRC domain-containing protein n=2 Tax=Cuscuta epithymum TaxID=186058 RepID=A0AAV0CAT2_9ASTE|nr:unnamed protein product [Cuscuta epithymum]
MRIRKHAKVSPLTYAAASLNSSALLQTHLCQLNQSPWDVVTFPLQVEEGEQPSPSTPCPPPPHAPLFDGCGSYPLDGSNEAVHSPESGMISPGSRFRDAAEQEHSANLCCKTDGKAWQCKREAKVGHTWCDHHMELLKHCNKVLPVTENKQPAPPPVPEESVAATTSRGRRPRPKKTSGVSSNPYDLYYYTGFGPLWGKKRGPGRMKENYSSPNTAEFEPINGATSSGSEMDSHGVEMDYLEDEFPSDNDNNNDGKKKKVRKPVKARSLKSLM